MHVKYIGLQEDGTPNRPFRPGYFPNNNPFLPKSGFAGSPQSEMPSRPGGYSQHAIPSSAQDSYAAATHFVPHPYVPTSQIHYGYAQNAAPLPNSQAPPSASDFPCSNQTSHQAPAPSQRGAYPPASLPLNTRNTQRRESTPETSPIMQIGRAHV